MFISTFTSFFLIIFSLVFTRAVRSALVLFDHGFSFLPYLWVIAGVAILAYTLIYNNILRRIPPRKVLYGSILFFVVTLIVIIRMIDMKTAGSSIVLYVWSDLMSVALTEQIWAMTHDRFSSSHKNWAYAFMGSGLVLGGVASGSLIHILDGSLDSIGLLWLTAGGLLALLISSSFIPKVESAEPALGAHSIGETRQAFKDIFSSRYLRFFFYMVLLSQIVSNLIDLAYTQKVSELYATTEERTKFIGGFTAILSSFSVLMLYVAAPIIYRVTNPLNALMILPLSNFAGSIFALTGVTFKWPGVFFTKLFDKGFNYSLQRASKEMLYRRTSRSVKYRVKTVLDVFVYRISELVAGVLTIPVMKILGMNGVWSLCIALTVVHVLVAYRLARMKPDYVEDFPSPESADEDGVICIGGKITADLYLRAYHKGIFPWPPTKADLLPTWFSLAERTVLFVDHLHIKTTLGQFIRKSNHVIRIDTAFDEVLRNCRHRPEQTKTWITDDIVETYMALNRQGISHSLEVWTPENELVAGCVYTQVGKTVALETSFTNIDSGGNFLVVKMVEKMKSEGISWIDLKAPGDYLTKLGAKEIPREEFMKLLHTGLGNS